MPARRGPISGNISLMDAKKKIALILDDIEQELRQLGLWGGSGARPHYSAFESEIPFFLDTMDFHQWLEYVLIHNLRQMIASDKRLPETMLIHTVAEELYKDNLELYKNLIDHLFRLDSHFNEFD